MLANREAPMSAQIRSLYASMPDRLVRARKKFGRPLTLSEKTMLISRVMPRPDCQIGIPRSRATTISAPRTPKHAPDAPIVMA